MTEFEKAEFINWMKINKNLSDKTISDIASRVKRVEAMFNINSSSLNDSERKSLIQNIKSKKELYSPNIKNKYHYGSLLWSIRVYWESIDSKNNVSPANYKYLRT